MIYLQLLINGLLLGGIYGLMSIGLNLIFGVLGVVNFAHGEFLMLAMYASYWLYTLAGIDPYVGLIIIIPAAFLFGYFIQRLLIQPIIEAPHVAQVFLTVGMLIVLQNLAMILWKADPRVIYTSYASASLQIGPLIIGYTRLAAFFLAMVIIEGLFLFLRKSYMGQAIQAVAQNLLGARAVGINITQTYAVAFAIGTVCVAIAGVTLMAIYPVYPTIGGNFVLIAFVVVVLGGLGNLRGTIIAGLIIGGIEAFAGFYLPGNLTMVIYFSLFILILIFRPAGLLTRTS
ncbi:MAG: branched-chain amino acid ABC transporter permease [Pseudomonadota bacterium]